MKQHPPKFTSPEHWTLAERKSANQLSAAAHILPTLTRAELQALIERHPERWAQFSAWLDKLPA